jgi:hypothetical protein
LIKSFDASVRLVTVEMPRDYIGKGRCYMSDPSFDMAAVLGFIFHAAMPVGFSVLAASASSLLAS